VGPVVFIGDDFTGASDTLATFARAGWRARLFLKPPSAAEAEGLEVVGLATALRAIGPDEARREIAGFWPSLAALHPSQVHLKVCSTFDSHPDIGSIGAAARALQEAFRPDLLAVIGGQPSLGRYAVFGTLFARGPDGVVYRIDRHPIMRDHPVTPMHEADLTRHLAAQGLTGLHLIGAPQIGDLQAALSGQAQVFLDAVSQEHIRRIGAALVLRGGRQLLIGSSSVAEALTWEAVERSPVPVTEVAPPNRNVLVFAGSRSALTRAQVAAAGRFSRLEVTAEALRGGGAVEAQAAAMLGQGAPVLLHLDPQSDYAMPPERLAALSSALLARVVARHPVGWLGIAGGDTSSRICAALNMTAIDYLAPIAPGVGLCRAVHRDAALDGMRLMLKGGQMGEDGLFNAFAALAADEGSQARSG
tara:strand:- start:51699 stop:52952 length:1254 start_codon:yes stop_codon:yes gene_type:complete